MNEGLREEEPTAPREVLAPGEVSEDASTLGGTTPETPLAETAMPETAMDRNAAMKGFAWTSFFSFISKFVFPLANVFVSRKLGPGILGAYALIQTTIDVADVIRDAGLTQNYLIEKNPDRQREATYAGLGLVSALVPALLVLILTVPMANFFHQPEYLWALPIVSVCLVLNASGMIPNARLLRKGMLREQGILGLAASSSSLILTLVLVLGLHMGFPALVIALAFSQAFGLTLLLRREPHPGFRVDRQGLVDLFKHTRVLYGANLLNNLFLLSDVFVIQRMMGKVSTGLYNSAQNIGYKPAILISFPLSRTLQIAFSQAAGDSEKLARALYRSLAAIVLFVLPIYVFIGFGSPTIILVLLGEKFRGSIPVLSALCLYLGLRTLGNVSGNALVPAGKHAWTLYPWYGALAVTGVGIALASRAPTLMNLVWAYVAGAIVAYTSILFLAVWFVRGDRALYARVGRAAAVSLATSAVVAAAFSLPLVHWGRFLVAGSAGLLVHLLLIERLYGSGGRSLFSKEGVRAVWHAI